APVSRHTTTQCSIATLALALGLTTVATTTVAQEADSQVALPAITVEAEPAAPALSAPYAGGQVAQGGGLGLLGTNSVMDTPFSTVHYTSLEIEESQAYMLTDVITHDASVRATTSTEGFSEDFQIRGFAVGSGDMSLNGLHGRLSSSHSPLAGVARTGLLQGP